MATLVSQRDGRETTLEELCKDSPELLPAVRESIVALGRAQGFTFVALDLAGFSSGSLNKLISLRKPSSS